MCVLCLHVLMTHTQPDYTSEIRAELARQNISKAAVAQALGKSRATASRKLSGSIPLTIDELHALAELVGLPAADLLPSKASA